MEFKEECVPQLASTFGWSVKIKSVQELEWGSRCVGSDIIWWKLCKDVSGSKCVPYVVVLSSFHQDEDLALKSPRIMVNKELVEAVLLWSWSKSDRNFSNLVLPWLGDLQTTPIYSLEFCKETLQITNWLRFDNFTSQTPRDSL